MAKLSTAKKLGRGSAGFSLVELMVVVAIIGILSSLAIPRFRLFQAKARQSEAKTNLLHIYTLEEAYYGDNDAYVEMTEHGGPVGCPSNDLGFILNPCEKARYTYKVVLDGDGFIATAVSGDLSENKILPGCGAETWTINQDKELTVVNDVTKADCKK